MSANPDAAIPSEAADAQVASREEAQRKPRFATFIATAGGLGYIPVAPGTWGSAAGLVLAIVPAWAFALVSIGITAAQHGDASYFTWLVFTNHPDPVFWAQVVLAMVIAALGLWSANSAAAYWNQGDPQRVVIDEVSGQHLALFLGCVVPLWWKASQPSSPSYLLGAVSLDSPLSWKYLLLGFILFRIFDIWKPFPARQAESLPGGWGIMADDWVAGIYAAIGLWIARAAGL
ncbi:MAG: phosphatidylglycerophosphatase A [Candidatus Acidiferrales bacterium]